MMNSTIVTDETRPRLMLVSPNRCWLTNSPCRMHLLRSRVVFHHKVQGGIRLGLVIGLSVSLT